MRTNLSLRTLRLLQIPLLCGLLLLPLIPAAQEKVTLEYCYREAEATYPLRRQSDLLTAASELRLNNLAKGFLPQTSLNGSASLQSDVTELSIDFPKGFPGINLPQQRKDWYKLTFDVNQAVYDGNAIRYQKEAEKITLKADRKGVEAEIYKLRERINQLFFTVILLQQNDQLIVSNRERLEAKLAETEAGVRNGAVLESNADLLRAELVRIGQQRTETAADRKATLAMLGELIGKPIPEDAILVMPDGPEILPAFENRRPENDLFDIQRSRTDLMRKMVITRWNPKLFAFGQAGYGRPGLNMLDSDFGPWWMVGAKVTWSPWNWNQNRNERKILQIQNDILKSQQETFDRNLRVTAARDQGDAAKYASLLTADDEIIALREKITRSASAQLANGVITSSDYIARLNEETQARMNREIHRIQLVKSKLSYLFTIGKM